MRLVIRDYRPSDRAHLARCLDAMQDHMVSLDPWHRLVRTSDHSAKFLPIFLRRVRKDHGFILVSEADGVPSGIAVAWTHRVTGADRTVELPTRSGFVGLLSVLPPWRNRGIGTKLLRESERRFLEAGCDQITLGVLPYNRKAFRLYEREGFEARAMFLGKRIGPPLTQWPEAQPTKRRVRRSP